eukprot:CAMPEP_0171296538 /NCGR_PEP_ID=MMETSP0816-20121228/5213_1 /TAXON_ID=420281 /ORGANISM="Proboscia inermis, Strain CCAP1064/1" /LENGTH=358 /DNA_ID=CAMNT_0011770063 /DNA_START=115 /DNA_END=1191 /DNA_ORIENTATION=+
MSACSILRVMDMHDASQGLKISNKAKNARRNMSMRILSILFVSALLLILPESTVSWSPSQYVVHPHLFSHGNNIQFRRARTSSRFQHHENIEDNAPLPPPYSGPIPQPTSENAPLGGISVGELGLDLAVAPSTVAPGSLGLYAVLSEAATDGSAIESATLPAFTLLGGYSRHGIFQSRDEGDKTVAFALDNANTAVFYERELMSVVDALALAAQTVGKDNSCGLAGHVLLPDENKESFSIYLDIEDPEFGRYFVPDPVDDFDSVPLVQRLGQFCNDLAWDYQNPPTTREEYDKASNEKNVVQLAWRLAYDEEINSLVPSWPVSILARDVTFANNRDLMELGTRYGWNYWQATVDLDAI